MSNLATSQDDGLFEPDEETLISALRNQDDIPILMDIVAEQTSFSASQETHLAHAVSGAMFDELKAESVCHEETLDEAFGEEASIERESSFNPSQALIAKAIAEVLEKRLPELVSEVMQALQAADETISHLEKTNSLEENKLEEE